MKNCRENRENCRENRNTRSWRHFVDVIRSVIRIASGQDLETILWQYHIRKKPLESAIFLPLPLNPTASLQQFFKAFVLFLWCWCLSMMSGDLSALVARLEAVTTRLESAADRAGGGEQGMISQTLSVTLRGNLSIDTHFLDEFIS